MDVGYKTLQNKYDEDEIKDKVDKKVWSESWYDANGRWNLDNLFIEPYIVDEKWIFSHTTQELHELLSGVNTITRDQSHGGVGEYDAMNEVQATVSSLAEGETVSFGASRRFSGCRGCCRFLV
jgi:hypothetical protein